MEEQGATEVRSGSGVGMSPRRLNQGGLHLAVSAAIGSQGATHQYEKTRTQREQREHDCVALKFSSAPRVMLVFTSECTIHAYIGSGPATLERHLRKKSSREQWSRNSLKPQGGWGRISRWPQTNHPISGPQIQWVWGYGNRRSGKEGEEQGWEKQEKREKQ